MRLRVRPQFRQILFTCLLVCCAAGTAFAGWSTSGSKVVAPNGGEFRVTGRGVGLNELLDGGSTGR